MKLGSNFGRRVNVELLTAVSTDMR